MRDKKQIVVEEIVGFLRDYKKALIDMSKAYDFIEDSRIRILLKEMYSKLQDGNILFPHTASLVMSEQHGKIGEIGKRLAEELEALAKRYKKVNDSVNSELSDKEKQDVAIGEFFIPSYSYDAVDQNIRILNIGKISEILQKYDVDNMDYDSYMDIAMNSVMQKNQEDVEREVEDYLGKRPKL